MIHTKLRYLRKKANKRLQDVAGATDLSPGYLSQIETGKAEPSISQLRRLAAFYGVGVVYFFESAGDDQILVKAGERPKFGRPDSPLVYELLRNSIPGIDLQAAIIKIAPYYEEPQGLFVTCQSEEFIYVLSGVLGFEYNGQMYFAEKGDSICYRASLPYRLFNPTADITEILGIGAPSAL
ncbi:helix-turn-helix transcriptional regulator [Ochrobactrum sp. CM-21-5]|nr:XRE family transcriptional regulator [Ochrobactrum sp. CM-21-5]MBC2885448.1 helix-turn-helix transcriptional regulator [Ochrobactrum sp. CM-21-5]